MCLFGVQPTELGNSYSCISIVSVFHFNLIIKHLSVVRVIMLIVHVFVPARCGQHMLKLLNGCANVVYHIDDDRPNHIRISKKAML